MSEKFYITTPLYYVNDAPHIGHAYTTIAADVVARFERLRGKNVHFLTGTDEHGGKIAQAAAAAGISPQEHADRMVEKYKAAWKILGISYDDFIRTTEDRHVKVVQGIVQHLMEKGDIYEGEYEGWYCVPDETFWTEKELGEDRKCPTCKRALEKVREKTFFFKQSKYEGPLRDLLKKEPKKNEFPFLAPASRSNEIVQFVSQGLQDLSISRTNLEWGIPIPGHAPHVVYVWFDALINYISAIGYDPVSGKIDSRWPADLHLMGKEIVRFHAVTWPTMLFALGLETPKRIFGHGWWTVEGQKMSKSVGNVVDPLKLVEEYGVDAVRYFLMREVSFGSDGDFSIRAFRTRFNADLANDLGNLLHRTLNMTEKYFGGKIPDIQDGDAARKFDGESQKFIDEVGNRIIKNLPDRMKALELNDALQLIWEGVGMGNRYIDREAPWILFKEKKMTELSVVIYNVLDFLYKITPYLYPFMPTAAQEIFTQMGVDPGEAGLSDPKTTFDKLSGIKIAGRMVKKGLPLFPRLEN